MGNAFHIFQACFSTDILWVCALCTVFAAADFLLIIANKLCVSLFHKMPHICGLSVVASLPCTYILHWFPFKPICLIRNYCLNWSRLRSIREFIPLLLLSSAFHFFFVSAFFYFHISLHDERRYHKMSASQVNTDFFRNLFAYALPADIRLHSEK